MIFRYAARFLMTAACLLCAIGVVFAQSTPKKPKSSSSRKRQSAVKVVPKPSTARHVVKQGETLYSIAGEHHTSVAAIRKANQLQSTKLSIGQRLSIPGQPESRVAISKPVPKVAVPPPPVAAADESEPAIDGSPLYISSLPVPEAESDVESEAQPLRYQLASMGLEFLGVKYRRSGESEASGFDCSGFVKTLFEKFQISLPRSSRDQYQIGEKVDKDKLEIGDLIFFSSRGRTPSHVGVYIGDDKFLHAALKARRVLISSLTSPWYTKRFLGARRLLDLWKDDPKTADTKITNNNNNN
jgi:peptidoglycan DL-endopeptidase LytE